MHTQTFFRLLSPVPLQYDFALSNFWALHSLCFSVYLFLQVRSKLEKLLHHEQTCARISARHAAQAAAGDGSEPHFCLVCALLSRARVARESSQAHSSISSSSPSSSAFSGSSSNFGEISSSSSSSSANDSRVLPTFRRLDLPPVELGEVGSNHDGDASAHARNRSRSGSVDLEKGDASDEGTPEDAEALSGRHAMASPPVLGTKRRRSASMVTSPSSATSSSSGAFAFFGNFGVGQDPAASEDFGFGNIPSSSSAVPDDENSFASTPTATTSSSSSSSSQDSSNSSRATSGSSTSATALSPSSASSSSSSSSSGSGDVSPRKRSRAMSVGAEDRRRGRVGSFSAAGGANSSEVSPPMLSLPGESLADNESNASQMRRSSGLNERAMLTSPSKLLQRDETTVNELLHLASAVSAEDADEGELRGSAGTDEDMTSAADVCSGDGSRNHRSSGQTLFHGPHALSNASRSRVSSPTMPVRSPPAAATQNVELVR